ncbi:unnamed protein product [Ixodes persulcatus]
MTVTPAAETERSSSWHHDQHLTSFQTEIMGKAVDGVAFLEGQAHDPGVRLDRLKPLLPESLSGDVGDLRSSSFFTRTLGTSYGTQCSLSVTAKLAGSITRQRPPFTVSSFASTSLCFVASECSPSNHTWFI